LHSANAFVAETIMATIRITLARLFICLSFSVNALVAMRDA